MPVWTFPFQGVMSSAPESIGSWQGGIFARVAFLPPCARGQPGPCSSRCLAWELLSSISPQSADAGTVPLAPKTPGQAA